MGRSFGDYLELASRARKAEFHPDPVTNVEVVDHETQRLLAVGWEPKKRSEKIIWKQPDNGFYYSQEMAAHFLLRGIGNASCKSGAN